ncbi:IgGFc-binding protein, partial [Dissostichus eleginoides]
GRNLQQNSPKHSDKSITVHAINLKSSSLQTALVLPIDKLSSEYLIPPVPEIQRTPSLQRSSPQS